jgi:hypothetical protein
MIEAFLIAPLVIALYSREREDFEQRQLYRRLQYQLTPPPLTTFEPGADFDPEKPYVVRRGYCARMALQSHSLFDVVFDSEYGIGQMPHNQNINYMGFIIWITPREFLRLVPYFRKQQSEDWLKEQIRNGTPLGAPMLIAKISKGELPKDRDLWERDRHGTPILPPDEPLEFKVAGYEGQARMKVLSQIGFNRTPIPVIVLAKRADGGEVRARHLAPEYLVGAKLLPDPRCYAKHGSPPGTVGPTTVKRITLQKKNYGLPIE